LNYQIIIPARGGSKRLPGKNIHPLNGIPMIAYSIIFAKKNFPDSRIWVNTDDDAIAYAAMQYGVSITNRPKELGSDTTSTAEVLFYQGQYFSIHNIPCDAMILLQPTNPLRPENLLKVAIESYETNQRSSLASFSILNRKFGKIKNNFFKPSNYKPGERLQDVDPDYYENGLIYITNIKSIQKKEIITPDVFPLITNTIESTVDIDEPHDILFAEFLIKNNLL